MKKFVEIKTMHDRFSDFREMKICGFQVFFMRHGPAKGINAQSIPPACLKLSGIDMSGSFIHRFLINYDDRIYYTPERLWCGRWLMLGIQESDNFETDINTLAEGLPEKEKELLFLNISREKTLFSSPSSETFYSLLSDSEQELLKKKEQPVILPSDSGIAESPHISGKGCSPEAEQIQTEEIAVWEGYRYIKSYFYGPDHSLSDKNNILKKHMDIIGGRDIIDAGAFFGDTAIPLTAFTKGTVHAFEPDTANYQALVKNTALNGCTNLKPINLGLFSEPRTLSVNKGNEPGSTKLSENAADGNQIKADTESVDSYAEKNNLDIGLIKSDIEGAEKQMLEGAYRTINRCHPLLMISIYHNYDDFFKLKPWLEKRHPGYEYHLLFPTMNLLTASSFIAETMLVAVPPR